MGKANTTVRALLGVTLFFMLLAALSFAAFHETKSLCTSTGKCSDALPIKRGGQMLWDDFSRHFISVVTTR